MAKLDFSNSQVSLLMCHTTHIISLISTLSHFRCPFISTVIMSPNISLSDVCPIVCIEGMGSKLSNDADLNEVFHCLFSSFSCQKNNYNKNVYYQFHFFNFIIFVRYNNLLFYNVDICLYNVSLVSFFEHVQSLFSTTFVRFELCKKSVYNS